MIPNQKDHTWLVNNYQTYLMELYPDFASIVRKEKQEYEDMKFEYTEHSFFNDLTGHTKKLIREERKDNIKELMGIAEILLEHGSEDVKNAVATCYIENLVNTASDEKEKAVTYETFIPYLGPKSKEYCKAWDEFTGCKTPGL
jgi:hypothetical protein